MSKECYDWIFVKGSRRRVENAFAKENLKSSTKHFSSTLQNHSRGNVLDLDLTTEGFPGCCENYLSRPCLFLREHSTINLNSRIDPKINATYTLKIPRRLERCIERIKRTKYRKYVYSAIWWKALSVRYIEVINAMEF